MAAVVVSRYAIPAVGAAVLLGNRSIGDLRHTIGGQASTTLIALALGSLAVLHWWHRDAALVLRVAEVIVPLAALGSLINLALAARSLRSGNRRS
jgi:hypothetical protein